MPRNQHVPDNSPAPTPLSVVLLGKVGVGKSASGNTILGEKHFTSTKCSKAVTIELQIGNVNINGREVVIYDTPGLCNPDRTDSEIEKIIGTVLDETSSNPRVFLLVVKCDRFTEEERNVICKVETILGKTLLENTVILFTRGDELGGQSIEDFIKDDDYLKQKITEYGERYHVFNNKNGNSSQVTGLLNIFQSFSQTPLPSTTNKTDYLPETRMILIGKTGVGKSATGNTILGVDHFKSEQSMVSVTQRTHVGHGVVNNRDVCVVDTPGLFDSELPVEQLAKEFSASIMNCEPGPHAFLIVMPINNRFTKHEREAIEILDKLFGPNMANHAILVFTHGDSLEKDNSVEKMIEQSSDLSGIVKQCGGRYQLINNRCTHNRHQVNELLGKIDKMLEMNGESYYTNEMFMEAARVDAEAKEVEERKHKKKEGPVREFDHLNHNQSDSSKPDSKSRFRKRLEAIILGVLIGAGIGRVVGGVVGGVIGGVVGGVVGGLVGEVLNEWTSKDPKKDN